MHRTHRLTALTLALVAVVALAASACSSDETAAAAEPTTTSEATLQEQATAAFQGVQLDLIDHTAEPGFTTMFFQDGSWAAMGTWLSKDVWCLAGMYRWTVTEATSPTDFTVSYERTTAFPDCVDSAGVDSAGVDSAGDESFDYHVTGVHRTAGRTVFEGDYVYPNGGGFSATRTVCGTTWDHPDRCGVATPGLVVPSAPVHQSTSTSAL